MAAAICLVMGCNAPPGVCRPPETAAKVRPVTDIGEFYSVWTQRFNAGDLDGLMDLYRDDVSYIDPEGRRLHGSKAIRDDFKALLALKPRIRIDDRVFVVNRDIALMSNHWVFVPDPASAAGVPGQRGGGIEVVRRQADGGWRYVIDDASRMVALPH